MSYKTKKCPFCGSRHILVVDAKKSTYKIVCGNFDEECWMEPETPECLTEEEARAIWNKRFYNDGDDE